MPTEVQIYKDGTIVEADIANKTITSAQIADKTITASQIADKTITASQIADNTITASQIADNTITASQLAAGSVLPVGVILMWSGSIDSIPTGWQLCNFSLIESGPLYKGDNPPVYTPNLTDRFIVGAGSGYAVGATGGSANAILVSHSHTGTTGGHSADHTHNFQNFYFSENNGNSGLGNVYAGTGVRMDYDNNPWYLDWTTAGTNSNHTHDFGTSIEGSSGTNANLPPYYALAFIMKIS
jgi:hypothetical protein